MFLSSAACTSDPAVSADAGTLPDAADLAMDAGRRPFDPSTLGPCEIDPSHAPDAAALRETAPIVGVSALADRVFPVLTVLDSFGALASIDGTDVRRAGLVVAAECAGELSCVRGGIAWAEPQAIEAAETMVAALTASGEVGAFARALRASGACALLDVGSSDEAFATGCVAEALLQTSGAFDARVAGELSASALDAVVDAAAVTASTATLWGPARDVALGGLVAAERDGAARYEPLAAGENAAALARVASVDFAAFRFVAIVVPGQGPDDAATALNPAGRLRADAAADRYEADVAPFLLLSGGHVHPDRTPFAEAIEMKRHLIDVRGIPENAILVDPYARHTTTNLRNATRLLVRGGFPTDRPVLVTSDRIQTAYIRSSGLAQRCVDELGYPPFTDLQAVSNQDSCFLFELRSFHVDARDPLDP